MTEFTKLGRTKGIKQNKNSRNLQTLEPQFMSLISFLDQNLYQTIEIWIYYINSALVTDYL